MCRSQPHHARHLRLLCYGVQSLNNPAKLQQLLERYPILASVLQSRGF